MPDFKYNLISAHKLCLDRNVKISFVTNICVMQEALQKPLLLSRLKNNLCYAEDSLVPLTYGTSWITYILPTVTHKYKDTQCGRKSGS